MDHRVEDNLFGYDNIRYAADIVGQRLKDHGMNPEDIQSGVILGSGLGSFAKKKMNALNANNPSGPLSIPFNEVWDQIGAPKMDHSVLGHDKKIIIGPIARDNEKNLVFAQSGREHPYEGISTKRATFWIRIMQVFGVKRLIGSNAAGVLTPDTLSPRDIMLVEGSLDNGGDNPLIGINHDSLGPRFPHLTDVYTQIFRDLILSIAHNMEIKLKKGIYIREPGPNYESPERVYDLRERVENIHRKARHEKGEKRFKTSLPVGTVGMSSTYEALVAQHAKQSKSYPAFQQGVAYFSGATNYAASLGPNGLEAPCFHEEVVEVLEELGYIFNTLVNQVLVHQHLAYEINKEKS